MYKVIIKGVINYVLVSVSSCLAFSIVGELFANRNRYSRKFARINHRISAFRSPYRRRAWFNMELDATTGGRTRMLHYYRRGHYYVGWCGIGEKRIACTQRATSIVGGNRADDLALSIVFNCTTSFLARDAILRESKWNRPTRETSLCVTVGTEKRSGAVCQNGFRSAHVMYCILECLL